MNLSVWGATVAKSNDGTMSDMHDIGT